MIAYKMCWKKGEEIEGIGPVLGTVQGGVFFPLSFKEAVARARSWDNQAIKVKTFLAEVEIQDGDVKYLKRLHPAFSELFSSASKNNTNDLPQFYTNRGTPLGADPNVISRELALVQENEEQKDSFLEEEELD